VRIWRLWDPRDDTFAEPSLRGAWSKATGELCPECTASSQHRVQPLIIEWESGSDLIGDFAASGFASDFVVKRKVGKELLKHFQGFELGPVEMPQNRKFRRPARLTRRTKPRVWLPYEGPELCELWVTALVPLERHRSTIKLVRKCDACGDERYEVTGVESYQSRFNLERKDLDIWHIPRTPGEGLFVRAEDLKGRDIFRVKEFDGWDMCTDRVKDFIEEQSFTNISFLEMGEVI
jgi:hypothetical protein